MLGAILNFCVRWFGLQRPDRSRRLRLNLPMYSLNIAFAGVDNDRLYVSP